MYHVKSERQQTIASSVSQREKMPKGPIGKIETLYVELQDQWNGPYFFSLKSIAQPPLNETAPIFFF